MAIDFLNKSSYIIYKWIIFHSYVSLLESRSYQTKKRINTNHWLVFPMADIMVMMVNDIANDLLF